MEDAQGGAQICDAVLDYSPQTAAVFVIKQTLGPWQTKSHPQRQVVQQGIVVPSTPASLGAPSSHQHGSSSPSLRAAAARTQADLLILPVVSQQGRT